MTAKMELRGANETKEHVREMERELERTKDPLLKAHIRQLRRAWGMPSKPRKAA